MDVEYIFRKQVHVLCFVSTNRADGEYVSVSRVIDLYGGPFTPRQDPHVEIKGEVTLVHSIYTVFTGVLGDDCRSRFRSLL